MGLVQYDAASLLRDSRVHLESGMVERLMDLHRTLLFENLKCKQSRDEYAHWFKWTAFQRNIKALGTFGYQVSIGNLGFEANIPPLLAYLPAYGEDEPDLSNMYERLRPFLVRPA